MARVTECRTTAGYVFSSSQYDAFQPRGAVPSSSTLNRMRSRSPRPNWGSHSRHTREPTLMTQDLGRSTSRNIGHDNVRAVGQGSGIGESPISDLSGTACMPDQETSEEDNHATHVGGVVSGFLLRPKSKPGKPKKDQTEVLTHPGEARTGQTQSDEVQDESKNGLVNVRTCPSCVRIFSTAT